MKKLALVVLLASLSIFTMNFACNQSQQTKAAQLADTLAHSISAVHSAIDVAHTNGLISDVDYRAILNDLLTADQAGLNINAAISGIAAGTSTSAQLNAAIQAMQNALTDGTARIKDPNTLAEVKVAVAALDTALTSIESFYPSK